MIFVLGITQRSGTNYLSDLLRLHPDCTFERTIPEDFLVAATPVLNDAFRFLKSKWSDQWDLQHQVVAEMKRQVGLGLVKSMSDGNINTVLKSPSIGGLDNFTDFFPDSKALIVVRDGRDVAVSYTQTWSNTTLKEAAGHWMKQSKLLRDFLSSDAFNSDKHRVVSYEKLFTNTETELLSIFDFLNLDLERFNPDDLVHLRIRGSSQTVSREGEVSWEPRKVEGFAPIGRYRSLSDRQQHKLNRQLEEDLSYWGYEL